MPLIINTAATIRSGVSDNALEKIRRMGRKTSPERIGSDSQGVNSQIREQVLANQGAARWILNGDEAKVGLSLAKRQMTIDPGTAQSVQAGSNLIDISHRLLD
jgi:hypothetical protein